MNQTYPFSFNCWNYVTFRSPTKWLLPVSLTSLMEAQRPCGPSRLRKSSRNSMTASVWMKSISDASTRPRKSWRRCQMRDRLSFRRCTFLGSSTHSQRGSGTSSQSLTHFLCTPLCQNRRLKVSVHLLPLRKVIPNDWISHYCDEENALAQKKFDALLCKPFQYWIWFTRLAPV